MSEVLGGADTEHETLPVEPRAPEARRVVLDITEPGDVWTSRLPRKFQDAAPRMIRSDEGVDVWRFERAERQIPVGATALPAGRSRFPRFPGN